MAVSDRFFDDRISEETRIKLESLAWYLEPWTARLGSYAADRGLPDIWYVDAFAGAGKFPEGGRGSPLIVASKALHMLRAASTANLAMICVEQQRSYFEQLKDNLAPFRRHGVKVGVINEDFNDCVEKVVRLARQGPMLLFLDPFGVSPINFRQLVPLISRSDPIDLILRIHDGAIHRLKPEHPDLISRAVGSNAWSVEWDRLTLPRERVAAVHEVLKQSLIGAGAFTDVMFYSVRTRLDRAPRYTLAFASRNERALHLWHERLARLDVELIEKASAGVGDQATFLDTVEAERRQNDARKAIFKFFDLNPATSRRHLIAHLIRFHKDRLLEREVNVALRALRDEGLLEHISERKALDSGTYRVTRNN